MSTHFLYHLLIIAVFSFILVSCTINKTKQEQATHPNQTNLFVSDKKQPLLIPIPTNEQPVTLSADSAYAKSKLVAICIPLAMDSFQQNNKTIFYLNTVKPLRILKGIHNNNQNITFISDKAPIFVLHDSGWVVYVEPLSQKKLLTYSNNIQGQWVENAPYGKTLF